jgi:hypothetical protein
MARSERPLWWPLFISLERALGEPMERAARSDEFADFLTRAAALCAWVRTAYEKATADALHRANLPAWSDLRVLADQITDLERRVADLAMELEQRRNGAPRPRSSRRRPRPSDR